MMMFFSFFSERIVNGRVDIFQEKKCLSCSFFCVFISITEDCGTTGHKEQEELEVQEEEETEQ